MIKTVMFGALAILFFASAESFACSCGHGTLDHEMYYYIPTRTMFVGKAARIKQVTMPDLWEGKYRQGYYRVTFEVEENIQFAKAKKLDVYTGTHTCGYPFQPGKRYFVDAGFGKTKRLLATDKCSNGFDMDRGWNALDFYREIGRPGFRPRIYGFVFFGIPHDPPRSKMAIQELGVELRLTARNLDTGETRETIPDRRGFFDLAGVGFGRWEIAAWLDGKRCIIEKELAFTKDRPQREIYPSFLPGCFK